MTGLSLEVVSHPPSRWVITQLRRGRLRDDIDRGRAGSAAWPLRLSQDHRVSAAGWPAGQRQAGRADLATREAESPSPATQARQPVTEWRIVHSAQSRAPQPRVVLR